MSPRELRRFPGVLRKSRVRSRGAELWLAALNPQARRGVDRSPLGQALQREGMFFDLEHAVGRYRAFSGA